MKMGCPNDNRPMWKYKHSLVNHTIGRAASFGFRRRAVAKRAVISGNTVRRPKRNPYYCELGNKYGRTRRLKAAEVCEETSGRRLVSIADHFGVRKKQLRCARCKDQTSFACLGCGVALCIATFTTAANHSPVSCFDVCHCRWKYDFQTGAVRK